MTPSADEVHPAQSVIILLQVSHPDLSVFTYPVEQAVQVVVIGDTVPLTHVVQLVIAAPQVETHAVFAAST